MNIYAYDIESYKDVLTVTFANVKEENDIYQFYVGFDKKDSNDIREFLNREILLVGYNNISYDDAILRYIISYTGDNLPSDSFKITCKLIDENYNNDSEIKSLRYSYGVPFPWHSIDLMRILGLNKLGISLKQTAINLKWHKIQDIPIDPNERVTSFDLDDILSYNLNDVLITRKLYHEIEPLRVLRHDLSRLYNVDLLSASDSQVANLILEHIYSSEFKIDIKTLRQMKTKRDKILLGDCVAKFVKFETPELNELLKRISSKIVYSYQKYRYSDEIYFANCSFALGIGGLHSKDEAGIFESNDEYIIQDMDVASYYPNLIINNGFYPQHLGPRFIDVLKKITAERMQAKKSGDKVKADGLKITVNSIFGKLGYEYFWLFDAKQFISTTINGQLGLLMLIEKMYLNGIEVISANTDGVVCRIPRRLESKYYEIAKQWEVETRLELEFTPYKKYVRRDVNSYITEKPDGETKEKGAFVRKVDLKKAYRMPIVPKALYEYFINDVPIKETIEASKDIFDFCISQKTGGNFYMELHTSSGVETLQKTNRFYISNSGGTLIKKDKYSERQTGIYVGNLVSILNDYDPSVTFEDYDVNLSFYEEEAMKILREVHPPQLKLFDNIGDWGRMGKMDVGNASFVKTEAAKTAEELSKLGKNQRADRIKAIVENQEKIEDISPRYVYIKSFDAKTMAVDVYCLSRGSSVSLRIDKKMYNRINVFPEQLIFCEGFSEDSKGNDIISQYKIVDNFEQKTSDNLF